MNRTFDLILPEQLTADLFGHLFSDGDEHGAVLSAGVVETPRGLRLLARELFIARDGVQYVLGRTGYRMLTARFVLDHARHCRDQGLAYLAVHNHGGIDSVAFSDTDLASHRRGYPALVDILNGPPVGALVFAQRAVAGQLWTRKGGRLPLREGRVVGRSIDRLYPSPRTSPVYADSIYDRQVRLLSEPGQTLLRRTKVGVIGVGGVGSWVVANLAHLGVGEIVVADPDRIEATNLPRVLGATRFHARTFLTWYGGWLERIGRRLATRKVVIARRVARRANPRVAIDYSPGDIVDDATARRFGDCDYIFLAADSHQARCVFNALVHQFLIPGVQIGTRIRHGDTGEIDGVFVNVRPVTPDFGCLWCASLIDGRRLQAEAMSDQERRGQDYIDGEPAASVVTLNNVGVGLAVNDFLFGWTGLLPTNSERFRRHLRYHPRRHKLINRALPERHPSCTDCGTSNRSRLARGDNWDLPTTRPHRGGMNSWFGHSRRHR